MNSMSKAIGASALTLLMAGPAFASMDLNRPFLCAIVEATSCELRLPCETGGAESVNMPDFVTIDVSQEIIIGARPDGTPLTTPVEHQDMSRGMAILQGGQNGVGWSINLNTETGRMTVSAAADEVSVTLFGMCTQ